MRFYAVCDILIREFKSEAIMFNKIKDFLYDISDLVLSLAIIAIIFYSVSWKISDTLKPEIEKSGSPIEAINPEDSDDQTVVVLPPEDFESSDPEDPSDSDEDSSESNDPDTPEEKPFELVSFVVETGSSGYAIGKKLEENGFVTSVNDFTKRIVELGVDGRLNAGEFKLSKSDDLDTIINVLIGRGRN